MKFVIDLRVCFAILLDVTNVEIESVYESITETWVSPFVIPLGCFCNLAKNRREETELDHPRSALIFS